MKQWIKTGGAYRQGYCANLQGQGFKTNPYIFASPRWFAWDDGYTAAAYAKIKQAYTPKMGGFAEMLVTVGLGWIITAAALYGGVSLIYRLIMGVWL